MEEKELLENDASNRNSFSDEVFLAIKKSRREGAIAGSVITAIVMFVIIIAAIVITIGIKLINGTIPAAALSGFSSGVINDDVYNKAEGIYTIVENSFLNDVDKEAVREGIYQGMMEALDDPYSVYYTKEEFDEMMESANGTFEGIGAYLQQDAETNVLTISRPMKDSPAEKAGLLSGDIITTVDGEDISEQDINLIVSKIKGPKGTKVVLGIKRDDKEFEVTVERALVYETSVDGRMLEDEDGIGYIYITSFEDHTDEQFDDLLDELSEQGMEKLIIDLRDNGGGYVDTCVNICDRILPEARIVSTKDKHGIKTENESSDEEFIRMPIVLLVNGNSASASEIMTGALKDNDYATVVGEKTFGKGIVQEVLQLDDGSGIKVTICEYYTPSGECIHGVGIEPDVVEELDVDNYLETGEDNQLKKAIEVIKNL